MGPGHLGMLAKPAGGCTCRCTGMHGCRLWGPLQPPVWTSFRALPCCHFSLPSRAPNNAHLHVQDKNTACDSSSTCCPTGTGFQCVVGLVNVWCGGLGERVSVVAGCLLGCRLLGVWWHTCVTCYRC